MLTNKLTLAVRMPRRACGLILKISECLPRSPANTHEAAKMLQVSPPQEEVESGLDSRIYLAEQLYIIPVISANVDEHRPCGANGRAPIHIQ